MQNNDASPATFGVRHGGVQKVSRLKSKVAAFAEASDEEDDG